MDVKEATSTTVRGIGITELLTVLFIGLKLTGFIDWSWWWVLSPLWIAAGFILLLLVCMGVVALIVSKL